MSSRVDSRPRLRSLRPRHSPVRNRGRMRAGLLLSFVLWSTAGAAESPEGATPGGENGRYERELRAHIFADPVFTPSPFITSHVALEQALIYASIPDFPIASDQAVDVEALSITERLELGLRFFDVFELFAFVGGEVLTGADVRSLVLAGSSFSYEAGLGAAMRLVRSESSGSQLSLRAQASAGSGDLLDLLGLINAVLEQDPATLDLVIDNGLSELVVRDVTRRRATAHALWAQALSQNFGLQAALGASYESVRAEFFSFEDGRTVSAEETTWSPDLSVAFDANAMPSLPLGLVLEYSLRRERRQLAGSGGADWGGLSHSVAAGLHGVHRQFNVGLTLGTVLGLDEVERADNTSGQLLSSEMPAMHFGRLIIGINW